MDSEANKKKLNWSNVLLITVPLVVGVLIGVLTFALDVLPSDMPGGVGGVVGFIVVIAVAAAFGLLAGVIVHEAGHLVFGLLTGWTFSSFRVGALVWVKEGNRIRFRYSPSFMAGQCLMKPVEDAAKFKFLLYNMGGVIGNLFLSSVFGTLIEFSNTWFLTLGLWVALLVNLYMAITNILPITNSEVPTDGANMLEALKSKRATWAFHMQLYINHEVSAGKRYRDINPEILQVSDRAAAGNYLIAYLVILEADYWCDAGNYEMAMQTLMRLDLPKLPPAYRRMAKLSLLYMYSFIFPDADKAREIYAQDDIAEMLILPVPQLQRIRAAYEYFVLGNTGEGLMFLEKARKGAETLPSLGLKIMESDYLDYLQKKF